MEKMTQSVCRVVEPAGVPSLNLVLETLNMAMTDVLHLGRARQPKGVFLSGVR
ncbi:MAG: hypothetical protein WA012_01750 [Rhodoferax sp.]|jgi:hypothetical protein|uniref:hypothetical protein n=1 Tax=Rhodoferax sp. TaxID=50421 RepID=UPI003BAE44F1|nr:hypothetical protein [Rhodoferax sp.]